MLSDKPMVGRVNDALEGMSKRGGHAVTCKYYGSTSIDKGKGHPITSHEGPEGE
jgi:hypothetical protein